MDYTEEDLTEVIPTDCETELCEMLKGYEVAIHRGKNPDEGYEHLREADIVITIHNPYQSDMPMDIMLSDEFTLYFGGYHAHYFPYASDFEMMKNDVLKILANELCVGVVYYWRDGEQCWMGSSSFTKEELSRPYQNLFSFVLKEKEFADKLRKQGGAVYFRFWDPKDSIEIPIEQKP